MVDRSLTSDGIGDDVLVKVDKFIFCVDSVVLDMEEDIEGPILGSWFLATTQVLIDLKEGELEVKVGDESVKFSLSESMRLIDEEKANCMRIDSLIPSKIELIQNFMTRDPLEDCITRSVSVKELDGENVVSNPELIETILVLNETMKRWGSGREKDC